MFLRSFDIFNFQGFCIIVDITQPKKEVVGMCSKSGQQMSMLNWEKNFLKTSLFLSSKMLARKSFSKVFCHIMMFEVLTDNNSLPLKLCLYALGFLAQPFARRSCKKSDYGRR